VFAAAQEVVRGRPLPWDEVAIAAGGALVLAALSVLFVTRMLATFRKRGYISRHV
jgi:ABC-2 type transport system permease protein